MRPQKEVVGSIDTVTAAEFDLWLESLHQRACTTFLMGSYPHNINTKGFATGVICSPRDTESQLMLSKANPVALALMGVGLTFDEAWLLVMAHEAGHIELNGRCIEQNKDPTDPNNQIDVIGLHSRYQRKEDFHKESAIEAFCDAFFVNQAMETLGDGWEVAVATLLMFRNSESARLGLFEGDEYATQPVLMLALATKQQLNPVEAAEIALMASISNRLSISVGPAANAMASLIRKFAEKIKLIPKSLPEKIIGKLRNRRHVNSERVDDECLVLAARSNAATRSKVKRTAGSERT